MTSEICSSSTVSLSIYIACPVMLFINNASPQGLAIHLFELYIRGKNFYRSVHYLNELEDRQTGIEYFETMIRYLLSSAKQLTKQDMENMIRKIERTFLEGSELAMTLADILREEGRKEGREEGREEGGSKALSETALQMLIERFGKVPQDIKEGIAKGDSAALKLLLVNSFKFQEIDEARKYIQ